MMGLSITKKIGTDLAKEVGMLLAYIYIYTLYHYVYIYIHTVFLLWLLRLWLWLWLLLLLLLLGNLFAWGHDCTEDIFAVECYWNLPQDVELLSPARLDTGANPWTQECLLFGRPSIRTEASPRPLSAIENQNLQQMELASQITAVARTSWAKSTSWRGRRPNPKDCHSLVSKPCWILRHKRCKSALTSRLCQRISILQPTLWHDGFVRVCP